MSANHLQWYCRTVGMELGPMPWSHLIELVRQGEITSQEEVRIEGKIDWQPANSVPELAVIFRLEVPHSQGTQPARAEEGAHSIDGFQITDTDLHRSQTNVNRAVEAELAAVHFALAAETARKRKAAHEERWFCHVGGVAYGPIRFSQLLKILCYKRIDLSPDDHVRHGVDGEWVRVDSVPALMRAAGLDEAPVFSRIPVQTSREADTGFDPVVLRFWLRRFLNAIPSFPSVKLPAWLYTSLRGLGRGLLFLGKYSFIIVPLAIWLSLNVIAVFFPETGADLARRTSSMVASPITWCALLSLAAYSGAIWLNVRRG
jgi:hypothetical protein